MPNATNANQRRAQAAAPAGDPDPGGSPTISEGSDMPIPPPAAGNVAPPPLQDEGAAPEGVPEATPRATGWQRPHVPPHAQ